MKIEIWSDFTCPYCYIGKRKLEMALERFGKSEYIEIEYKSYELDPEAERESDETKHMMLMKKYGLTSEKVIEMLDQIVAQGREIGLHFQFENVLHTNTFNAHRLVKYAMKLGKHHILVEKLFEQYFQYQKNIGRRDVLLSLANEIGLDEKEIDELLCLNKYGKKVRLDEEIADELGITGVPFFVFNETYAVSGVLSIDQLLDVLQQVWEEANYAVNRKSSKNAVSTYCTGNECKIE